MNSEITLALIASLSLLISIMVTATVKRLAIRFTIGALPDERRVHKGFIPLLGGLGIFSGFLAGILLSIYFIPEAFMQVQSRYLGVLIAALIIILLGMYDDIRGTNAPQKIFIQLLAIIILISFGCTLNNIHFPFGYSISLGYFAIPITILWILTVNNAVNLLDGLDGLAGGVSLIVALVFLVVGWQTADLATIIITLSLIAGIAGFLIFNYHPATIFMGDTGSLFLGFILAAISLRVFENSDGQISIMVPLVALAIPIGDTAVSFFRRLNNGKHPFKPDKDHLHHRLLFLGLSHIQAVHIIYLVTFLYGIAAYFLATGSSFTGGLLLLVIIFFSYFGLKRIGYLEAKKDNTFYGDKALIRVGKSIAPLVIGRFWHSFVLIVTDLLMINLAFYISWFLRFKSDILFSGRHLDLDVVMNLPLIILVTLFWIGLFALNDLYKMRWDVSRFDQARRISKIIIFGILVLLVITIDPENVFSAGRITTVIYGGALIVLVNSGRLVVIFLEKKFAVLEYGNHNTLLVGTTDKAKRILKDINQNSHLLYNIVGYVSKQSQDKLFYGLKPLGTYEDIPELLRKHRIEEVIIAINERSRDEILNIVATAHTMTISFKILPQIYDVVSGHKTEEVIGHPLLRLFPDRMLSWQWAVKRLFDIVFSLLLLIALSPIGFLLVLAQIISGTYPPFKIVNIVGKFGKVFGLLNFATDSKERHQKNLLARFLYKSRIYKLPALLNILMGKMSFVGPRPETVEDIQESEKKIRFFNRRFQIRPGLTGWAQVKYRYEEAARVRHDQFKQDLFYLENMSLTFDFRILIRSIGIFLFRH